MRKSVTVGGVAFDTLSLDEAAEAVICAATEKKGFLTVTLNALMLHRALHDGERMALYQRASLILPDGIGVVLAAKYLKTPFSHGKVAGVSLGERVIEKAAKRKVPIALFGGKDGIAQEAKARLCERFPELLVVFAVSGFGFSRDSVREELEKSGARLVFVCLGSPLQEKMGLYLSNTLSLPALALGGSLDVYAKRVKRAPRVFRAIGLEWLWRMLIEPRRFREIFALFSFVGDMIRLKKAKKSCK